MLVSDPCLLNVGGVSVGVTSTDVLFHLSAEEVRDQIPETDFLRTLFPF